jgi:hypothetical protein
LQVFGAERSNVISMTMTMAMMRGQFENDFSQDSRVSLDEV